MAHRTEFLTVPWAKPGTRPSAPHDQRTPSAYIFGAICPKLGKAAALVVPWCDTYAMTQHLAEISILPLPPKSPELNPVENLWLFMRENWLSNRIFKSYDGISPIAAMLGASSKTSLGASCPSAEENG
ncbi:hypothetical protein ACVINY_003993 [Sinorhizobium meliloti]